MEHMCLQPEEPVCLQQVGEALAETAGALGGTLEGVGVGGGGGAGGFVFDMQAALAGLEVGLGAADVATVQRVAGSGSGLALLLERLEGEIAAAEAARAVVKANGGLRSLLEKPCHRGAYFVPNRYAGGPGIVSVLSHRVGTEHKRFRRKGRWPRVLISRYVAAPKLSRTA